VAEADNIRLREELEKAKLTIYKREDAIHGTNGWKEEFTKMKQRAEHAEAQLAYIEENDTEARREVVQLREQAARDKKAIEGTYIVQKRLRDELTKLHAVVEACRPVIQSMVKGATIPHLGITDLPPDVQRAKAALDALEGDNNG
jgi:chromosome segregation ATPase